MKIEVVYSTWGVGDEAAGDAHVFHGGVQEVEVTPALAPYLAAGEAAGAVKLIRGTAEERELLKGHVQSQAEGEAAYAEAIKDGGGWREGQLEQFTLDAQYRLDNTELEDGERAFILAGVAAAHDELGNTEEAEKARAAIPKPLVDAFVVGDGDVASVGDVLEGGEEA